MVGSPRFENEGISRRTEEIETPPRAIRSSAAFGEEGRARTSSKPKAARNQTTKEKTTCATKPRSKNATGQGKRVWLPGMRESASSTAMTPASASASTPSAIHARNKVRSGTSAMIGEQVYGH